MVQTKSFEILKTLAGTLTPDDILRDYCLLMDIPNWQCEELHLPCEEDQRRSPVVAYVECVTGTRLGVVERRKSGMSTVQIFGTLISAYAAHMMLIQQLVELPEEKAETEEETSEGQEKNPKAKEEAKPDDTDLRCYYCNNKGHRKKDCRKWLNEKQDEERDEQYDALLAHRAEAAIQEEKKFAKWAEKAARRGKGRGQKWENKGKSRGDLSMETQR
jgi:hypothetical protein